MPDLELIDQLRKAVRELELHSFQHGYTDVPRNGGFGRCRVVTFHNEPSRGIQHHAARENVERLIDHLNAAHAVELAERDAEIAELRASRERIRELHHALEGWRDIPNGIRTDDELYVSVTTRLASALAAIQPSDLSDSDQAAKGDG